MPRLGSVDGCPLSSARSHAAELTLTSSSQLQRREWPHGRCARHAPWPAAPPDLQGLRAVRRASPGGLSRSGSGVELRPVPGRAADCSASPPWPTRPPSDLFRDELSRPCASRQRRRGTGPHSGDSWRARWARSQFMPSSYLMSGPPTATATGPRHLDVVRTSRVDCELLEGARLGEDQRWGRKWRVTARRRPAVPRPCSV